MNKNSNVTESNLVTFYGLIIKNLVCQHLFCIMTEALLLFNYSELKFVNFSYVKYLIRNGENTLIYAK